MYNVIIVRYGEIGTKSAQTRRWFENLLVNNVREALLDDGVSFKKVVAKRGRVFVKTNEAVRGAETLTRVFGIVSLSPAMEVDAELEKINKTALKLFRKKKRELGIERPRFRVTARRITKEFPLKSPELQAKVGEYILENEESEVNLHEYEVEVGVELMEGKAYVFTERIAAWGGLPIGTQGKVVALLSGPNSALASFLMMKRGVEVIPLHIKRSEEELEEVRALWGKLRKYAYGAKGELVVSEGEMVEEAMKLVRDFGAKGIVMGRYVERFTEELGEELVRENEKVDVPIFYPLIGLPCEYVEEVRRRVGL
ncbi:tRNA 4-thiouridine(8) synthase ThiI [Palaeococcus ferrophilus]|uniref:tRNA 4-thiouridine(8) synthase ThiI n=1 Tax=Palaeococcus ferrophilus TaxID=83868 RepID=UPI00064FF883|nr:tRNA 4-thiouridine(8) synthase ThiI [Palaeococcus ferrophilus]